MWGESGNILDLVTRKALTKEATLEWRPKGSREAAMQYLEGRAF